MSEIAIINFISVLNVLINVYLIINKIPNTSKLVKKYDKITKLNKLETFKSTHLQSTLFYKMESLKILIEETIPNKEAGQKFGKINPKIVKALITNPNNTLPIDIFFLFICLFPAYKVFK